MGGGLARGLRRWLLGLTGNAVAQRVLARTVETAHYFMGVGAGSDVATSGEAAVLDLLRRRTPTGPLCVFDVGANRGQFCAVVRRALGDRAVSLHAFEPSADAFAELARRVGGQAGVRLNRVALGARRGRARLFYDRPASGLASLTRRDLAHLGIAFALSEDVEVETLDEYCRAQGVERIDLLKLDVEGHELDVLRGATGMLGAGRVGLVTFEFGGCHVDTRTFVRDFFRLFGEYGMALARITPSGYLTPLPRYREDLEQFRTTNFVAIRP